MKFETMKFGTMKNALLSMLVVTTAVSFQSCGDDDDPVAENEEELITDVVLTLNPQGGGTAVELSFSDPDGEVGSTSPTYTVSGALQAGTTYTGSIILLNSLEEEDITEEVKEEDDEHLFCYSVSGLDLDIDITDFDENQLELGVNTIWVVGDVTGAGSVNVVLKHQPGVKDGTCAPGDSDVDITFDIEIE